MAKGKRRAFNDPAKQLKALQKSSDDVIKAFGGTVGGGTPIKGKVAEAIWGKGINTKVDDDWVKARGRYFWTTNGTVVDGTNPFFQEYSATYTDEDGSSQTEKNAETTESWADKWASENGL